MLQGIRGLIVISLCTVLQTAALAAQDAAAQDAAALARGRSLTQLLYASRIDSLTAQMSEGFLSSIGGRPAVTQLAGQVSNQLGGETEVVSEETHALGGLVHYYRVARFAQMPNGTVTVQWSWREGGQVVGGLVRPTPQPASTEYADYRTQAQLHLPFEGEWIVGWGGRAAHQNYHVVSKEQRFAYDLLVARNGSTYRTNGTSNEDYFCFGEPILAPAAGAVVFALDSLPDNTPGQMAPEVPPGNHVIIDHGNEEYSLLAHLQRGSVSIAVGDRVERSQQIGTCGNSGNSSEPHLHYHLQTAPRFGEGVGLPAFFNDYRADGANVSRGEPVRGQRIESAGR
jgi:hypothetical protein